MKTKSLSAKSSIYSLWFLLPGGVIFALFFLIPNISSLYYSLTVWDFETAKFCGLDNFKMFFSEASMSTSVLHTFLYAFLTSGFKVVLAFLIAVFLTGSIHTSTFIRSVVFFPNLVSTISVGITFAALMHPTKGVINALISALGGSTINFLGDSNLALLSVIAVDVWKGLGIATVIFIAGIQSIDRTYYEAAAIDGASGLQKLRYITLPLVTPAMNSIILLSFIGGLRSFDLIWSMTKGGPGYATDVLGSVIYKQYAYGFYGLSTAGNVVMLIIISIIAFPLQRFLLKREEAIQ